VAEIKTTTFTPRWMREASEDDLRALAHTPFTGSRAETAPRVYTRILPPDRSNTVSAKSLSEAVDVTQAIANYAGYDVSSGTNPDFADLRSVGVEVLQVSRLTVEPFEEGSFVIAARLDSAPIRDPEGAVNRPISAQDVADRFDEILGSFQQAGAASRVSIGAIQAIESLGRIVRRESARIEFYSYDIEGERRGGALVDAEYVDRVARARASRQPTRAQLESLEGTITALDIREGKLQLSMAGRGRRVAGTFPMLYLPSLAECLGQTVRLYGYVEWRGKTPISIQVFRAEIPNDAQEA
jgi:hypothetical protein